MPDVPWHAQRDRIAEAGCTLAVGVESLGKMARDIVLLSQNEVAEAAEGAKPGKGGSSTMPHKRNPVGCAVILAAAERVPALAATLLHAMPQEHERGLGNWHAEWETLPEIFRLTAGASERAVDVINALFVDPQAMLANLETTRGLIFAEAVSMALAEKVGKPEAHRLVQEASQQSAGKRALGDVLTEMPKVREALGGRSLNELFDPKSYLGASDAFVDRVLARARAIETEETH